MPDQEATTAPEVVEQAYLDHVADLAVYDIPADAESVAQSLRRERVESHVSGLEARLAGPHRSAAYRRLVLQSQLPAPVKVTLCQLLEYGRRLENSFPKWLTVAKRFGGSVAVLKRHAQIAVKAGWLARIPLTTDEAGHLIEVDSGGRFTSAWGNQFNVPPNVIAAGHPGIPGPRVWTNRIYAGKK